MAILNRKAVRRRIHRRIRKKITGTAARPRLAVHFSNRNIYAQVIDDDSGKTVAAASTMDKGSKTDKRANAEVAAEIGKLIAERAKAAKVEQVVFDRGGFLFHTKVRALADAARDNGLQF